MIVRWLAFGLALCGLAHASPGSSDPETPENPETPAAEAEVQDDSRVRVEGRVSALLTDGFFIDVGAEAGLEPGDVGFAYPAGQARVEFQIRSVSKTVARAEPTIPGELVDIGTRVDLQVPKARLEQLAADELPWSAPPEEWNDEMPLLAPAKGIAPEEREKRLFGRFYSTLDNTWDEQNGSRENRLARIGTDLRLENPFGKGGAIEFDGEIWNRSTIVDGTTEDDETNLRIDRLSYRTGGTRGRPEGIQVGRFLQSGFPEFGVIDGVEYAQRTESGNRWGATVGLFPEPNAEMSTGDDIQSSLYFRHLAAEPHAPEWGVGYQKTWHTAHPDRDLFVTDARWRPDDRWSLYGSAWVDIYTQGDTLKSPGPELTELRGNANCMLSKDTGFNLSLFRSRYPQIERNEFVVTPEQANNELTRVGLGGWKNVGAGVRLSGRVDRWSDDHDSGTGGEVRAGWRDGLYSGGEISAALFGTQGAFSSLQGVRLEANKLTSKGFFDLTWEIAEHTQDDFFGSQKNLLQQALRAAWDTDIGDWDLSLYGEDRFGDEQDSYSLGFYLQRRF